MAPSLRKPTVRRSLAAESAGMGSSVVAFLVAGVVFMGSVVAVLVATNNTGSKGTTDESTAAAMRIQARDLAGTVLGSPGFGASGVDWADGANYNGHTLNAEGLARLGLLDDQSVQPNMLEFAKLQNLRRAKYAADPADGYVDYQEAVHSLGLDAAGLDFHMRAYPALDSVVQLLREGRRDANLKVAYIGDVNVTDPLPPSVPPSQGLAYSLGRPIVCSKDAAAYPNAYRLSLTLTNGGKTATQFTAFVTSKLGTGAVQTQNTNGLLVQPGQSTTLFVDVAATEGRSCAAGSTITFDVYDPVHGRLLSIPYTLPANETVSGATPNDRGLYVDTNLVNYRPTDHVVLNWNGGNLGNNDRLILRVCKGTAECTSDAADANRVYQEDGGTAFKSGNKNQRSVDIGALPAGNYTAWIYDCGGQSSTCAVPLPAGSSHLRATERILVTAAEVAGYTPQDAAAGPTVYDPSSHAAIEVEMLASIVERFCPTYFFSKVQAPVQGYTTEAQWDARCSSFKGGEAQPGDVFPDTKKFMNGDLPKRLLAADGTPRYDLSNVLVVGSKVDQNAMTSASAKQTIRDWVVGGGTLIVFGSSEGNVNWLEPLFHSAIRAGGGGISTPDISHPLLHTPDELDDPAHNYDPRGEAWRFNGQTAQVQQSEATALFTNVIVENGDATTGNPLLADSRPGAIGNGSVILTSYLPYDLYNNPAKSGQTSTGADACPGYTTGGCESLKFIHNLLMAGYGDLYLDYGPECPQETNCIPEVRAAQIRHPEFTDPVQLRLNVFVFPH